MLDAITHRFINSCRYVIFAEKSIKFDQIINKYNLLVVTGENGILILIG